MKTAVGGRWPPHLRPLAPNGKIHGPQPPDPVVPKPSNTHTVFLANPVLRTMALMLSFSD